MSKFYINGEIVGRQSEKMTPEDVCPSDMQDFIGSLQEGEEIAISFNSLGGDVFAGLQICSLLREASSNGHKTIANVTSIAASIASVIACACDELNIYDGCYLMAHLPWTCVQGNAKDLQKEISTLEQCKNSMVKIYKTKFNISDEEISNMLEAETWIDTDNFKQYCLDCNIIENDTPVKIAASLKKHNFKNLPKGLNMEEEKKEVVVQPDLPGLEEQPAVEEQNEEEKAEEQEPTIEQLKARIAELEQQLAECQKKAEEPEAEEKTVTEDECNKRVAGMQSKMQAKINDFISEIKVKDEELAKFKAEAISLKESLDKVEAELKDTSSALQEKCSALADLNSAVNTPSDELPTLKDGLDKCSTPAERVAFITSGKYKKL